MGDKVFYMTGLELGILLDSVGIHHCFCFDLKLNAELTREEVIYSLYALVKRQWIVIENNRIQVQNQIAEIVNGVKEAKHILLLSTERGNSLAYLGEKMVTVSATMNNQYRLQVRTEDPNSFTEWIEEEGVLEVPDEINDVKEIYNRRIDEEKQMLYNGTYSICSEMVSIKSMDMIGKESGSRTYFFRGMMNGWIVSETLDGVIENVAIDCTAERRRIYESLRS